MSGVVAEVARAFLLCLLSLSEFFLSTSNWAAAWWIDMYWLIKANIFVMTSILYKF